MHVYIVCSHETTGCHCIHVTNQSFKNVGKFKHFGMRVRDQICILEQVASRFIG